MNLNLLAIELGDGEEPKVVLGDTWGRPSIWHTSLYLPFSQRSTHTTLLQKELSEHHFRSLYGGILWATSKRPPRYGKYFRVSYVLIEDTF